MHNSDSASATKKTAAYQRPMAGALVAHYRILSALDSGGMAQVFVARDTKLERNVAIKFLRGDLKNDSDRIQRFILEARIVSALNHPYIVTIHDNGECPIGPYIVMELVEGITLRNAIKQGLSDRDVLEYATQIASALSAAHAVEIVHRDIKPENIMIRRDGYVKVLDFGLARVMADEGSGISVPGLVVGTLKYMSPEQGRGANVTAASDIFSLGLVFHEMAHGHSPFENGPGQERQRVPFYAESSFPGFNRALPPGFHRLVARMIETRPEMRPTTADVYRVLEECRAEPVSAKRLDSQEVRESRIVGRRAEREVLLSAVASSARNGMLVCISGEAGLGKTTLVDEFLRESICNTEGSLTGRGRCSEFTTRSEPYLPVLGALDSLLATDVTGRVERAMRSTAPNWFVRLVSGENGNASTSIREQAAGGSTEMMKRELGTLFQALSQESRLVLFFDDVQWADDSTVDAISYLSSQFDQIRVLVVATFRQSELLMTRHPFLSLKLTLKARNQCREIELGLLSQEDVERYLVLRFPENRFPSDLGRKIHRRTDGHPLFVADLVFYLKNRLIISEENGRWILKPTFAETEKELPESVRSMIQRKQDLIGDEDRKLLETASIQGYEFDSAVITKILNMDPLLAEERFEDLERVHRLVRLIGQQDMPDRTPSCRYQFAHSLYQKAFLANVRPVRNRVLSGSTARAFESYYGDRSGEIAGILAPLYDVCQEFERAAHYYLLAAQNACSLFAYKEGARLARRGLEMLQPLPVSADCQRVELLLQLTLGRSLALTSGYSDREATACFGRAQQLLPVLAEETHFFPAIWGLWVCQFVKAEINETSELCQQLLRMAGKSSDIVLLAGAKYAMALQCEISGDVIHAEELSNEILSLAETGKNHARVARLVLDPVISAQGVNMRALWSLGFPDRAAVRMKEAVERTSVDKLDPRSVCDTFISASLIHKFRGNTREVVSLSNQVIEISSKYDLWVEGQWALFIRGWAMADEGAMDEGLRDMQSSLESLFSGGVMMFAGTLFACALAESLGKAERFGQALQRLVEAQEFAERTGHQVFISEIYRTEGHLKNRQGADCSEVEECFRKAIAAARQQRALSLELRAAMSLADFWQRLGRSRDALDVLEPVFASFNEGFETSDLCQARTLLDRLR